MKRIKQAILKEMDLQMLEEPNVKKTRFTKYIVIKNGHKLMESFYYQAASNYFDMVLEEGLKK